MDSLEKLKNRVCTVPCIWLVKPLILSCVVNRLGRVSVRHVFNLLDYMTNETETTPVLEALLQLNNLYRLLDKRQEHTLVARMKVQTYSYLD